MTPEAQKICEMIERVDVGNTDDLDEIDREVWNWLCGIGVIDVDNLMKKHYPDVGRRIGNPKHLRDLENSKYSTSRDALKAIRPEGWKVTTAEQVIQGWVFILRKSTVPTVGHEHLPTEELAELHAIIQAIDYERENK